LPPWPWEELLDGPYEPIQGKLSQDQVVSAGILGHDPRGGQNSHGHGKVKPRPLLLYIRRRQVYSDAIRWEMVARVLDSSFNPLFALPDCPFRETHCRKGGQALRNVHFHLNHIGVNSHDSTAEHLCKHRIFPFGFICIRGSMLFLRIMKA